MHIRWLHFFSFWLVEKIKKKKKENLCLCSTHENKQKKKKSVQREAALAAKKENESGYFFWIICTFMRNRQLKNMISLAWFTARSRCTYIRIFGRKPWSKTASRLWCGANPCFGTMCEYIWAEVMLNQNSTVLPVLITSALFATMYPMLLRLSRNITKDNFKKKEFFCFFF